MSELIVDTFGKNATDKVELFPELKRAVLALEDELIKRGLLEQND